MIWEIPLSIGAAYLIGDACRAVDIYITVIEYHRLDLAAGRRAGAQGRIDEKAEDLVRDRERTYDVLQHKDVIGPISLLTKLFAMPPR